MNNNVPEVYGGFKYFLSGGGGGVVAHTPTLFAMHVNYPYVSLSTPLCSVPLPFSKTLDPPLR